MPYAATDQEIASYLRAAGLPVRPCGLNASWACRCWHLGPGEQPNREVGYYLLDNETVPETYTILCRDDSDPDGESPISALTDEVWLTTAIAVARQLLKAGQG